MEKKIDNIIKESINKFILNERLSSVLYHFTRIGSLYNILKSDSFKLRSSYGRSSDDKHRTKKFYLSCTRQRSGLLGYSRSFNVRITLDGDLLNHRYEGGAIDYWGKSMGKQSYYDKEKYNKVDYYQSSTENEDRIYSDVPFIKNASKYIKRIDILCKNLDNNVNLSYLYHILLSSKSNIIYIYNNEKDFNYQTDNTINSEISDNSNLYKTIPNSHNYKDAVSYGLSHMLSFFILVDKQFNDYKGYCAKMLRKYNLDDYIPNVLNGINIHMNIDDIDSTVLDGIRTNGDNFVYENSFLMLRDFLRDRGFRNIIDAVRFVNNRHNRNKWSDFDYDLEVDVFAFQPNGNTNRYGNTIILHPDKTLFWSIEEFQHAKKYFINDIERSIRSHKSGNDEKFYKYLQHMVKGKITVSAMLSFLSKLDTNEENIIDYIFSGSFKMIKMKYNYIDDQKYVNDSDKNELEEKFRV